MIKFIDEVADLFIEFVSKIKMDFFAFLEDVLILGLTWVRNWLREGNTLYSV